MERRDFLRACAAGATLAATAPRALAAQQASPRFYSRALLVDALGEPFRASALKPGTNYIFHYPFGGTPCFLLDLGKPTQRNVRLTTAGGRRYVWNGGVGAGRSIVAFSAICAHQLAYPTRQISFISYRNGEDGSTFARPETIHCCAEHSEYDPARGGKVLGGPANQPLAAILLEHEAATDRLFATGTLGGELFNEFFRKYDLKLTLEHGSESAPRAPVASTAQVSEMAVYCQQRVNC
ncbi:MAG: twin-arginine translocation signal domain-containing protein [Pseudomonadota bacterium]